MWLGGFVAVMGESSNPAKKEGPAKDRASLVVVRKGGLKRANPDEGYR